MEGGGSRLAEVPLAGSLSESAREGREQSQSGSDSLCRCRDVTSRAPVEALMENRARLPLLRFPAGVCCMQASAAGRSVMGSPGLPGSDSPTTQQFRSSAPFYP